MHNANKIFISQHGKGTVERGIVNLQQGLQEHFNHSQFRGAQEGTLNSLINKQSLLALMPTGTGKSLCYQYPVKVWGQFVLVLSPLIALMQDQTMKARELGIEASFINSSISSGEREVRLKKVAAGKTKLLFVTPERFRSPEFREVMAARKPDLLVVDEAHCISQWGHDFRPDYSKISEMRTFLGNPLTLALTATATLQVQEDILKSLGLVGAPILSAGVERPNLGIHVHDLHGKDQKFSELAKILENRSGTTLIYTTLIDTLKEISRYLEVKKISHLTYHGDLPQGKRKASLNEFMRDEKALMLATPAFGLGIDKPNIRKLVHFEIPGSLESYYQEIGRAGRDGLESEAHLLFDEEDTTIQMEFIKWSYPEISYIQKVYDLLRKNRDQVNADGFDYFREQLSFRNRRDFRPEASIGLLEKLGAIAKNEKYPFPYEIVKEPTAAEISEVCNAEMMKNQNLKLLEVLRWAKQTDVCRLSVIYKYFGHEQNIKCGKCDVCR